MTFQGKSKPHDWCIELQNCLILSYLFLAVDFHEHVIEEVHVERGTAGASSEFDHDRYNAEKAFHTNYAYGWKSKNNYGNAPEMVWYKFRDAFVPAEVTFRSNGKIGHWAFSSLIRIRIRINFSE